MFSLPAHDARLLFSAKYALLTLPAQPTARDDQKYGGIVSLGITLNLKGVTYKFIFSRFIWEAAKK